MHVFIHTYIYTYILAYYPIHTYIHKCTYSCKHTYIHTYIHSFVLAHIHTNFYIYTHTHTHTHTCLHTFNQFSFARNIISETCNIKCPEDLFSHISSAPQDIQSALQSQQPMVDQLSADIRVVRHLVERTRPSQRKHMDVDRLENEVRIITTRWENVCHQVVER